MPRDLDSAYPPALESAQIVACLFAAITFSTGTQYMWSGLGNYAWNGQAWKGLGDLCGVTPYQEGTEVTAQGIIVSLSGIDNTLLGDCLYDIQLGLPATVWLGLVDSNTMQLIGQPVVYFGGVVDAPKFSIGPEKSMISLALETNFLRLQQGQRLRLTASDQRRLYPDDTGLNWVPALNDMALVWA